MEVFGNAQPTELTHVLKVWQNTHTHTHVHKASGLTMEEMQ